MRIAAATIAVTIAAGVVGFGVPDHTLPDSRELRKVSFDFLPNGAAELDPRMVDAPQTPVCPPPPPHRRAQRPESRPPH